MPADLSYREIVFAFQCFGLMLFAGGCIYGLGLGLWVGGARDAAEKMLTNIHQGVSHVVKYGSYVACALFVAVGGFFEKVVGLVTEGLDSFGNVLSWFF